MRRWYVTLHPFERVALIIWSVMLLGITIRLATIPPLGRTVVHIYLKAGEEWLAGGDVYAIHPGFDAYRNPPGVTPFFVPLTFLPARLVDILWRFAGAAVFLLGFRAWLEHGLPFRLRRRQRGMMYLLSAPLVLASLNNGQTNTFLAGFLLLGTAAIGQERYRSGAAWLAAAAAVKLYPAAVGLLVAAAFPRRVLPWFLGVLLAFLALPFLFQRPEYVVDMYASFAFYARLDDRTFAVLARAPQDLFLLMRAWIAPPDPMFYAAIQLGTAFAMALFVITQARRGRSSTEIGTLALSLGCIWMTILGPASEPPTYTVLAPVAALAMVRARAERHGEHGRTLYRLAILAFALLISPIVRDAFPNGASFRSLAPMAAGGLVLLVVIVWQARHRIAVSKRSLAPISTSEPTVSRVTFPAKWALQNRISR